MGEILVVEDDPKVLALTGEALKTHGYRVTLTPSPEEALRLIKENPDRFAVILLDWKLRCPIDGDMVLKLAKRILPQFKTPVIFVTGHTKISSKYLMRIGAFDTLAKPVTNKQLIDAIERALHKKKEEDPHRSAPAELNSQDFKKHEKAKRIVHAISSTATLAEAARMVGCSRRSLYRWLQKTGLHNFIIGKNA